jgi:hypothetical protein
MRRRVAEWVGTPIYDQSWHEVLSATPPRAGGTPPWSRTDMPGPIITRAQWGARYANGFGPAPLPATEVWLHHSVTTAPPVNATFEQDAAAVRTLEQIGQSRFGGGISYTWPIAPSGRIFEGHSVNRRGAHTAGHNTVGRAICLIGNYMTVEPSPQQIESVRWLLYEADANGWITVNLLTGGHRDVGQTACPGDRAYARIPQMNVPWTPPPQPTPIEGDVMQSIELTYYDDTWQPDPAGLNFRASAPAELGDNSAVVDKAWVRWSVHWGMAFVTVKAWNGATLLGQANPTADWWELPAGVRSVTVEGRREDPAVQVGATLLVLPK